MKLNEKTINVILEEIFKFDKTIDGKKMNHLFVFLKALDLTFEPNNSSQSTLQCDINCNHRPGWGED